MKIYTVNGRKVWLDKAPAGYVEPKKVIEEAKTEEKAEPDPEPVIKAKATPKNKARKAGSNK